MTPSVRWTAGPRSVLVVVLVGLLLASVLSAVVASAQSARSARGSLSPEQRAREIGSEAYVYGSALLDQQHVLVHFPPNLLINVTALSTPALRLVALPNVDTLYTDGRLQLGDGPFIVHVPEERGRYYTLELLDAYTNAFAYIGRRVTGTHSGNFAIVGPGWHGRIPNGVKRIQSPTATVWLIGRTLVKNPADVVNVNAIQHRYTLTPLSGFGGPPLPAAFVSGSALKAAPLPRGLDFYDAMDAVMGQNPPPRAETALLRRLASVGLGPGRSLSTERLDAATRQGLLAGLTEGRRRVERYKQQLLATSERLHNGWLVPPNASGRYGSDYLLRAYIASTALGFNVPAEATYLSAYVDHTLTPLTGRHRYVLCFAAGELPPVSAFWSITMYGRDEFLVPNPIDRYEIGDRTPRLRKDRGGSLNILIQHSPPRGNRSNWLPAPTGAFVLFLRLYQPKRSVLRGSWPLPTITRVG
jgi:hypothetical protein